MSYRAVAIFAVSLSLSGRASAAVVVLANSTADPIRFTVTHPGQAPADHELAVGEVRPFTTGRTVDVGFTRGGKATTLRLEAYAAYVFVPHKAGPELRGIGMAGKPVPSDDIPVAPPAAAESIKVPVKLLVDDADARTRRLWEPALRKRFERAAGIVTAHCPIRFEVVDCGEWESNPEAADLAVQFADFRRAVRAAPAKLAVGYLSRGIGGPPGEGPFAVGTPVLHSHVLIRERVPRTEEERVEVLVQQLGRHLGAVRSPDPHSAMRIKLGDGKAAYAKFRVGFDPLNTLALNLWAEGLRGGDVTTWTDLPRAIQARLGRVYATLAEAMPDDPLPQEYAGLVSLATGRPGEPPGDADPRPDPPPPGQLDEPRPAAPPRPAVRLTAKQDAARKVVRAVVQRATQNSRRTDGGRLDGDELTTLYVKAAADAARTEQPTNRAAAFLIGLGIGLDDSEILRKNPFASDFCKAVESDEERKVRLAVFGAPTVRDRRDLCQHFVVSAALTELVGATLAEQAGLAKELIDMRGASGFSFTDLCTDVAGVEFAKLTRKRPELLDQWRRVFKVEDFVPRLEGLRDGLSDDQFKRYYGSVGDERFKRELEGLRKRVLSLRVHASDR